MKLRMVGLSALGAWGILYGSTAQAADTTGYCATVTGSPVVMCEDFDDYCTDPPCDDASGDDTPNQSLFLANWTSDGCLETDQTDPSHAEVAADVILNSDPVDNYGSSMPFAARQIGVTNYFQSSGGFGGTSHRYDLQPGIAALDPTKGAVDGTDANPLTVKFVLDMAGTNYASASANRYLELTDGSDRAAAEAYSETCPDGKVRPRVAVDDGLNHNSIALGVFALISNPCEIGRPLTYRLSIYNGDKWTELKPGIYGATNNGLYIRQGLNTVTMVIKSSTIEVQIDCTNAGAPYTASAIVNRVYTGPFAAMHIGNGACTASFSSDYFDDIAVTAGELADPIPTGACCRPDAPCVENATADGCVNWYGGTYAGNDVDCATAQCATPAGACCLADATCQQVNADECAALEGYFHGEYTACGTVQCCPIPFGDADKDTDLDMVDFAQLQKCVTDGVVSPIATECACFNRDGDTDVDLADVEQFVLCGSGPGVAFDRQNPPVGCQP